MPAAGIHHCAYAAAAASAAVLAAAVLVLLPQKESVDLPVLGKSLVLS
jgi:hypothetical protein